MDGQPGPTNTDIDAAAQMSDGDRAAMIESMVTGLDAKLKDNPTDKDGWLQLIRSYVVLGKSDLASDALRRAQLALVSDTKGLSEINALGSELGLSAP
jgi:cytochrome c-type biogenesis protein CcmH